MGVLNVTPDSFSDGGRYLDPDRALARARQMRDEGADLLDVGGESTRPGAPPVDEEEEKRRVLPVLECLAAADLGLPISLDTNKAAVARAGAAAGASLINDVSAGTLDPEMLSTVAALGLPICLMHLPVRPGEMGWSRTVMGEAQDEASFVAAVAEFLRARVVAAREAGIAEDQIVLDPGFGFGKSVAQNLTLLRRLPDLRARVGGGGLPLLMGTSRKSTIGRVLGEKADRADPDRVAGTAATVALSIASGVDIVRVHDVGFMVRVARMADAVMGRGG